MVIKTREKLIDVARQLFAHKGMENTTMSDIANASEKGRRTLYTYFKNKREIFNAVLERDSEQLVARLREVAASDLTPVEKLRTFIDVRLDILNELVEWYQENNTVIRSLVMRDVKRVDKIRHLAIVKEHEILESIIREGVKSGDFDAGVCQSLFSTLVVFMQGLELSRLRGNFPQLGINPEELRANVKAMVMAAVMKSKQNQDI